MDCTTILLIWNERDNIAPLTRDILRVYRREDIDGEVLLLDDGSTDGSAGICDALAGEHRRVRVVHHRPNRGRSFAIQTGFREARGKVHIIMDGDYQYEPREIPAFLSKMAEGYDVVSGYRHRRADTPVRRLISRTYNRLIIGRILGMDIRDQNSGFKAFTAEASRGMNFEPRGFLGLHRYILAVASLAGYSITEIPIEHYDRPSGSSYIKFYSVPFITLRDYLRFRKVYLAPARGRGKAEKGRGDDERTIAHAKKARGRDAR